MKTNRKRGVLILEPKGDQASRAFEGELFGAPVSSFSIQNKAGKLDKGYGEIVFNTSLTGYQEILTDPSYYGQMICMTNPHIGNTGINLEDMESKKSWCGGFVVQDFTSTPSNWRATQNLENYLIEQDIPGITGVDTRALTRFLRSSGVLRGVLLPIEERDQAQKLLQTLPQFEGRDLIQEVTTPVAYSWPEKKSNTARFQVVALDFGIKWNLLRELQQMGCQVTVLPATSTAEQIYSYRPDGVFLSNGPGDPAAATYAVKTVREILGKIPVFGVCMGHQILSLALGGKTYKLKFGHRGGNQPVINTQSKKVEISSHNHGYAVDAESLPSHAAVSHTNLNDQCVEGISVDSLKAFSVQYHPEACPGPHDSGYLFNKFYTLMEQHVREVPRTRH